MTESPVPLVDQLRAALGRAEEIAKVVVASLDPGEPWWESADLSSAGWIAIEDSVFIAANGPDVALRTIKAHREVLARYETAVVSRDVADGTVMAGATRLNLRIHEETLQLIAAIYFPESGDTG